MAPPAVSGTQESPPLPKLRKSRRIKELATRINPARIVGLLAAEYGLSREEPSFEDRKLYLRIIKLFPRLRIIEVEAGGDDDAAEEEEEVSEVIENVKVTSRSLAKRSKLNQSDDDTSVAQELTSKLSTPNASIPSEAPESLEDHNSPGPYEPPDDEVSFVDDDNTNSDVEILNDQTQQQQPTSSNSTPATGSELPPSEVQLPSGTSGTLTTQPESSTVESSTTKPSTSRKRPLSTTTKAAKSTAILTIDSSSDEDGDQDDTGDYKPEPERRELPPQRIDPTILEKAYRYWTKQSSKLSVPLVVDPELLNGTNRTKNKKVYRMEAVLRRYPVIEGYNTLHKYHRRLLYGNGEVFREQITKYTDQKVEEARAAGMEVTLGNIRTWGLEAKAIFDPNGKYRFEASDTWIKRYSKSRKILCKDSRFKEVKKPRRRYYRLKNEPSEPQFDEYGFRIHPDDQGEPRVDLGVMEKLNKIVAQRYKEAIDSGATVTNRMLAKLGLEVKAEIDPRGMLLFTASTAWVRVMKIRLGLIGGKKEKSGEEEAMKVIRPKRELRSRRGIASTSTVTTTITTTQVEQSDDEGRRHQDESQQAVLSIQQGDHLTSINNNNNSAFPSMFIESQPSIGSYLPDQSLATFGQVQQSNQVQHHQPSTEVYPNGYPGTAPPPFETITSQQYFQYINFDV